MRLRAYFMIRQHDGPWNTWLCQDLDGILEAWDSCSLSEFATGVLHLGFQSLDTADLEGIVSHFEGELLLTESARHGLPKRFTASTTRVGSASGVPLYRVEGRWGMEDLLDSHGARHPDYQSPESQDTDSWLASLSASDQSLEWSLKGVGIHDDRTYYRREWCLKWEVRRKLGISRASELGSSELPDPCRMAKAAPPWLIDRPLLSLNLRVRAARVFRRMELKTVRELACLSRPQLLDQRHFGETSCRDVLTALNAAIEAGPPEVKAVQQEGDPVSIAEQESESSVGNSTLFSSIWETFQSLTIDDARILAPRLGILGRLETLEGIAKPLGLTRERIRQLECQALKQFFSSADWLDEIDKKVNNLRKQLQSPLSLSRAEVLEPWFRGVSKYSSVIDRILRKSKASETHIVEISGTLYFASISQKDWNDIVAQAKQIMSRWQSGEHTRKECLDLVSNLLPEDVQEFAELLSHTAKPRRHS